LKIEGKSPRDPKKGTKYFLKIFFFKTYMVRLVGPLVKPFSTTVKKEGRKKFESWKKICMRVYRGYVPPWSLVEEGIAPRWRCVTSRVANFEIGDGGGREV